MRKTNNKGGKSETRDRIIAASREYFFKNGHRGVTMEELAEVVGVSKKTLYVYFPTKLAILEAVMDLQFTMLFDTLEAVRVENEDTPIECLEAVIAKWQEILSQIQPVFWRDVHLDARNFLESTEVRRRKIVHGIFERIIRDGIEKGDFTSDSNPETGAEIMLAAIEGLIRSERLAQMGFTTRELIMMFVRRMIEGSLSDEGRKKLNAARAAKPSTSYNHEQS
jgi:AcrR family transcriptional regulator